MKRLSRFSLFSDGMGVNENGSYVLYADVETCLTEMTDKAEAWDVVSASVARAIMTERERCAREALAAVREIDEPTQAVMALAYFIADAIRNPEGRKE